MHLGREAVEDIRVDDILMFITHKDLVSDDRYTEKRNLLIFKPSVSNCILTSAVSAPIIAR